MVTTNMVISTFDTIDYNEFFIELTSDKIPNIKQYYWVSNYGRIFSTNTNSFLVPHANENGYLQVSLMTETGRIFRKVHRLVLIAFRYFQGYEEYQGNHKDGNKLNNYLYNLEWMTPKENVDHAINNNLRKAFKGSDNPKASITEESAKKIGEMLISKKYTDEEIFQTINCNNINIVRDIAKGNTWSHLFTEKELDIMKSTRRGNYISNEDKHNICKIFEEYNSYNKVIDLVKFALNSLELEISDRNIRIARRLYYKYDNPEITRLYNY